MQCIIIGNAPFSNTPLPSSFTPAANNRPLLYITSKQRNGLLRGQPTKKSGDGQAKFHQSFSHFPDINTAKSGGINLVKCKKD
jgi:hypothetical protein